MNEYLLVAASWLAGIALGLFFYAGLWLTIQKGLTARHPAVWFAVSLLIRISVVLAGLYFVCDRKWPRLLSAVAGFMMIRLIVARKIKKYVPTHSIQHDHSQSGGDEHEDNP